MNVRRDIFLFDEGYEAGLSFHVEPVRIAHVQSRDNWMFASDDSPINLSLTSGLEETACAAHGTAQLIRRTAAMMAVIRVRKLKCWIIY